MPQVPKRRGSRSRKKRRQSHDSLENNFNLLTDEKTGSVRESHHVDFETGTYKGRQIMPAKDS